MVTEWDGEEAVRKAVELEEKEVFRAAVGVAEVAVGANVVFVELGHAVR